MDTIWNRVEVEAEVSALKYINFATHKLIKLISQDISFVASTPIHGVMLIQPSNSNKSVCENVIKTEVNCTYLAN